MRGALTPDRERGIMKGTAKPQCRGGIKQSPGDRRGKIKRRVGMKFNVDLKGIGMTKQNERLLKQSIRKGLEEAARNMLRENGVSEEEIANTTLDTDSAVEEVMRPLRKFSASVERMGNG